MEYWLVKSEKLSTHNFWMSDKYAVLYITNPALCWMINAASRHEICALAEPFAAGCQQEANARFTDQRPRRRKPGGGRKGMQIRSE